MVNQREHENAENQGHHADSSPSEPRKEKEKTPETWCEGPVMVGLFAPGIVLDPRGAADKAYGTRGDERGDKRIPSEAELPCLQEHSERRGEDEEWGDECPESRFAERLVKDEGDQG
jgi:hypothetical protein